MYLQLLEPGERVKPGRAFKGLYMGKLSLVHDVRPRETLAFPSGQCFFTFNFSSSKNSPAIDLISGRKYPPIRMIHPHSGTTWALIQIINIAAIRCQMAWNTPGKIFAC